MLLFHDFYFLWSMTAYFLLCVGKKKYMAYILIQQPQRSQMKTSDYISNYAV